MRRLVPLAPLLAARGLASAQQPDRAVLRPGSYHRGEARTQPRPRLSGADG